jgi:cardiolipin synthase A/B
VLEKIRAGTSLQVLPEQALPHDQRNRRRWQRTASRIVRLGQATNGNDLLLFTDGDDAFTAMLGAIERATARVWLETYMFAADRLGRRFIDALAAAAARGVQVLVLVDGLGSRGVLWAFAPVRDQGGEVVEFNPPLEWPWLRTMPAQVRDHRKILIVDDDIGFCGGMNHTEEYAGENLGVGRFRDTHLLIGGPAVAHLAEVFARSWQHATRVQIKGFAATAPKSAGVHVQILGSDRFLQRRGIQRALRLAVGGAHQEGLMQNTQFVPPPRLLSALLRARRRGVRVEVLTAGISDIPIAQAAARHLYGQLLEGGVKVWELQAQTLHAKTASIDGLYGHVGSFNLDRWSYDRNLEVCAVVLDPGFATALAGVFRRDTEVADEVTATHLLGRGVGQRVVDRIAWTLCRL